MKRAVALFLSLGLALGSIQPAHAQDAFNPDTVAAPANGGVFLLGETGSNVAYSTLIAGKNSSDDQWICQDTLDPECAESKVDYVGGAGILPPCESDQDENCVVGLEISIAGQPFEKAQFVRSIEGMKFPQNEKLGFFEQSTPSLWDAPNSPSASGTTGYAVMVRVSQGKVGKNAKFQTDSFIASVVPFREDSSPDYEAPYQYTHTDDALFGRAKSFAMGGYGPACAWIENGQCGIAQDFANQTKIKLTIRISNSLAGWFQGRIKNPSIDIQKFSRTNNEVTVVAEPAVVQRMVYTLNGIEKLTAKERRFREINGYGGLLDSFKVWARASDESALEYLNHFKSKMKDTAAGSNTIWNFGTAQFIRGQSPCLNDTSKVLGIVSTNAMVYDGGVPKFNKGFLDYKVAGLHYEADGVTEVMGSYDLVMRSDVARCLYGFNKAPVSATITIAGEGDKNIATTVVSEKGGWLKLAAYDFTFSQKTIKVKLTQKKSTITCVAPGKKSKKVTGFSPKCPKGFKKR